MRLCWCAHLWRRKTEQAVDNAMNPGRNKDKYSNKGKNNQSNDNDYNESENQVDNKTLWLAMKSSLRMIKPTSR
ncbi:MAG: hypothetical protein PUC50_00885 [Bacteroidales bacterium]|nr:hypothetical protein [Bacteroidales bacterium]